MPKKHSGPRKIPLNIKAALTRDGDKIPIELIYNDETFEVKNPVKSFKLHEGATRYRCVIDNSQIELYNLGDDWWMVQDNW